VRPQEARARRMHVGLLVGEFVMVPVRRDPLHRRVLQRAQGEQHERVLEPFRHGEAAMREQAVIARVKGQYSCANR